MSITLVVYCNITNTQPNAATASNGALHVVQGCSHCIVVIYCLCLILLVSLLVSMITLRYMWIWIVVVFGFEPGTGHCQNWPTKLFACLSNFL